MVKYKKLIDKFSRQRLLVIGDLVLDQYIKGSVSRISPEAPVPVVLQKDMFYTPGGAANVANNLSQLKAKVSIVGKIGNDLEGKLLKKELKRRHVETNGVFVVNRMNTILKTRIIAQHQQVVRVDREGLNIKWQEEVFQKRILPFLTKNVTNFDAVVISDYGKGMIHSKLVNTVIDLAQKKRLPIVVDPKVEHLKFYGQVTTITPNKKEAEDALKIIPEDMRQKLGIKSIKLDTKVDIECAGRGLLEYLQIDSLLITLGEQGMYLFEKNKKPFPIATRAQEVFDVSGAGDTVISVFALALASGATKRQAADIANYAAGVVVGKMGAVAIGKEELMSAIKHHND